ncbi:class I SAM-dependent methyltransferase [Rubellimicrobium sp. CFH 75288]|uniref:class I SAM-dependent methyltransferase n=1 Tax=Rubellimicrobium sp. CFH 75288 TaxID=2697034 RepID=UPI001412217B|nr:methyltransferase [Rubellimicrobium sp. CFH 75288]NAZ37920.1 methyltransferase [Rubellimicrobium sp. CFH 75288]
MAHSRLAAALSAGLSLPSGPVLVLRPPATADLSSLDPERLRIHHTSRPDHDAWALQGLIVEERPGPAEAALVFLPRAKALARGLVAQAAALAPLVLVDGARTDGIDSLWRDIRARRPEAQDVTLSHGRLIWFAGGPGFEDWQLPGPQRRADGLWSQPGVFSADGPDPGSALLAGALPPRLPARMADLGAGIGVLSLAVLSRDGVQSLDVIESERLALDCARLNIADPRARFCWADAVAAPLGPYDGVVMNPPFHASRTADPALGRGFVAAAARALGPRGTLWMVANRHLPYEAALRDGFRHWEEIGGNGAFKLLEAREPRHAETAARPGRRLRAR